MKDALAVAGREAGARLRDRTVRWVTAVMVVLVVLVVAVPALVGGQVPRYRVAAAGDAAQDVVALAAELGRSGLDDVAEDPVTVVVRELRPGGLPAAELEPVLLEPDVDAERLVRDGDVAAAVVGDELDDLRLVGDVAVPLDVELLVDAAASRLSVAVAAAEQGLTADQVAAVVAPRLPAVDLLDPRPEGTVPPHALALVLAILSTACVLVLGMDLAQSVAERKRSGDAAARAWQAGAPALVGAVAGTTAVALAQVVVVVLAGVLAASATGRVELRDQVLGVTGWFLVAHVVGFATFAFLWATAGALAVRETDLGATTVGVQVLVVLAFFAVVFALEPGAMQRALSWLPFSGPLLVPARVALGSVGAGEAAGALVLLTVVGGVVAWAAARVHRTAVPHTEARLGVREAWRGRV